MRTFAALKTRLYEFWEPDGSSRDVIALYAGPKRAAFIEISSVDDLIRQLEKYRDDSQLWEEQP